MEAEYLRTVLNIWPEPKLSVMERRRLRAARREMESTATGRAFLRHARSVKLMRPLGRGSWFKFKRGRFRGA